MKVRSLACLAALSLGACAGPNEIVAEIATENENGIYSTDNLATSDACFAETPSTLLRPGRTLLETGPGGIIRVSHAHSAEGGDYAFAVVDLTTEQHARISAANAALFQAAAQAHSYENDAVIYHRSTDGTFCTVVADAVTGRALVDAAEALQAELAGP